MSVRKNIHIYSLVLLYEVRRLLTHYMTQYMMLLDTGNAKLKMIMDTFPLTDRENV